jgi:hypothetical protein
VVVQEDFPDPTIRESADRRSVAQATDLELESLAEASVGKPLAASLRFPHGCPPSSWSGLLAAPSLSLWRGDPRITLGDAPLLPVEDFRFEPTDRFFRQFDGPREFAGLH